MKQRFLIELAVFLLVLLWTYAAVSKLLDHAPFQRVLAQSPLVGAGAGALAVLVPATELGIALLLLFPRTRFSGLYGSFVLLVLLTSYLGYMVLYAPHLPCSCGGVISSLSWMEHMVFNSVFLVLNLIALFLYQKTFYRRSILFDVEADGRVENA